MEIRKENTKLRKLTLTGLMIAFTFVAGSIIKIPTFNGMVHLGDCMVLLSGVLLGKKYGAFAGSLGMALVDITAGYFMWVPFTLIIKGLMGFTVGLITEKMKEFKYSTFLKAFIVGGIINIVCYYLSNAIIGGIITGESNGIIGSLVYATVSLPGDTFQSTAGVIIALILVKVVYNLRENFL